MIVNKENEQICVMLRITDSHNIQNNNHFDM